MHSSIVVLLWLALIIALSLTKRRQLGSRRLSLMRALFPSWRFFDQLEHVPKIFFRFSTEEGQYTPWQQLQLRTPRKFSALFFNPIGNLNFAFHSLTEQLISDVNDYQNFQETVSYRLMVEMVRFNLQKRQIETANQEKNLSLEKSKCFQFKVSILSVHTETITDDILVSPDCAV